MLELDDRRTVTASGIAVSPTQRDLLRLVAGGLTAAQIGRRFGVEVWAVSNRLHPLYKALEVRNATHAVARGHELGLIEAQTCSLPVLSRGRRELLRRLALGQPDKEIASAAGIHVSRLRHRIADMYRAMGARNRAQAVHLAFCGGILGGERGA